MKPPLEDCVGVGVGVGAGVGVGVVEGVAVGVGVGVTTEPIFPRKYVGKSDLAYEEWLWPTELELKAFVAS